MASEALGSSWYISPEGCNVVTADNTITDKSVILQNALNADLKEIGSPILNKEIPKNILNEIVLQIQKIRNISAPKANEDSQHAPRMLKLVLTDGEGYIQALEKNPIPFINRDKTAPGTKLLIKSAKICSGYLLLDGNNCKLLGGQVPSLFEKWEMAKSVQQNRQISNHVDGRPVWVNFGCKVQSQVKDPHFKSLGDNNKTKNVEGKEVSEFELQRKDAIAEAASGAIKKVFGGGTKQNVINSANNPPAKKTYEYHKAERNVKEERRTNTKKSNSYNNFDQECDEKIQKPSDRVNLYQFLLQQLPPQEEATAEPEIEDKQQNSRNNIRNNHKNYNQKSYGNQQSFRSNDNNNPRQDRNESNRRNNVRSYESKPRFEEPQYKQQRYSSQKNETQKFEQPRKEPSSYYEQPKKEGSNYYEQPKKEGHNFYEHPKKEGNNYYEQPRKEVNNYYDQSKKDGNNYYEHPRRETSNYYQQSRKETNNYYEQPRKEATNHTQSKREPTKFEPPSQQTHNNFINDQLGNNFSKMSVNSEFASRSFRQHLNLGPQRKPEVEGSNNMEGWRKGQECMAKYWEDGKQYRAVITDITDTTLVVKFKGYDNYEEVLKSDCSSVRSENQPRRPHTGTTEFRSTKNSGRRK